MRARLLISIATLALLPLAGEAQVPRPKPIVKETPLTARLNVTPGSPITIGTPVALTGSAAGGSPVLSGTVTQYYFGYKRGSESQRTIQDWATNASATWTPPKVGTYRIVLSARRKITSSGQWAGFDTDVVSEYKVTYLPATVALHASPASGQAVSPPTSTANAITFTAVLSGCCQDATTTKKFLFLMGVVPGGNLDTARGVVETRGSTASWTPNPPPPPGSYRVVADVTVRRASDNVVVGMKNVFIDPYVIR